MNLVILAAMTACTEPDPDTNQDETPPGPFAYDLYVG
jgi:hypothetical protein